MNPAPKADKFEQFARLAQQSGSSNLVQPQPIPFVKNPCALKAGDFQPHPVAPDMSTKEELYAALKEIRAQYAPFLRELAPAMPNFRTRLDLKKFTLNGEEEIIIPHYAGPLGNATQVYTTQFTLGDFAGKSVYFCCRGADYKAEVLINGRIAGTHEGFFGAFEFDITHLVQVGENDLDITLKNDFCFQGNSIGGEAGADTVQGDKLYAATGPGYDDAPIGWHHCPPGMGLYQDVYIEVRNTCNITDLYVQPELEKEAFTLWAEVENATYEARDVSFLLSLYGQNFEETVFEDLPYAPVFMQDPNMRIDRWEKEVDEENVELIPVPLITKHGKNIFKIPMHLPNPKVWQLDKPNLYQLQVKILYDGKVCDCRKVSFGMRSFTQDLESDPKGMFYLNGEKIRLRGANTMGFEQQDVMNGDIDQLIDDILLAKLCNMNYWRLTQRPVQDEIYEYCDKLGFLTQTDLPLFGVMRRTMLCEGARQVEEMIRLVRPHPCNVVVTYINERWVNACSEPHRHMLHDEMEVFFEVCDRIVEYNAPGYIIKHCDGDFDPPTNTTLPDIHCYTLWYNGGQLDFGKLYRGFSQECNPGWYYGCGEFGAEGMDFVDLMRRRYPAEWIAEPFDPGNIVCAQSKGAHGSFFDTPTTIDEWVEATQAHQYFATKAMTESFRRDPRMVSFAIHLFIDAWPSGWMKTIMDCERNPKPAYFAYRKALSPVLLNLRSDRFTYYAGETVSVETHICNDTNTVIGEGWQIKYELHKDGKVIMTGTTAAKGDACTAQYVASCEFTAPEVSDREKYSIRGILLNPQGEVVSHDDFPIEIFADVTVPENTEIVFMDDLTIGEHQIAGETVSVVPCPKTGVYFLSRKTGHEAVAEFQPMDFRMWYDAKLDRLSPIAKNCFRAEGFRPILICNGDFDPYLVVAEKYYEGKRYILSTADLRQENPIAKRFLKSLYSK